MKQGVNRVAASVAAAALAFGTASVRAADGDSPFYVGALGSFVKSDTVRDADRTGGGSAIIGLSVFGGSAALELNGFGVNTRRESDGGSDYAYGGGLDLTLGEPAAWQMFTVVGGGGVSEDFAGVETRSPYANVGLGIYLPFFGVDADLLWRLEGRMRVTFYEDPVPGQVAPAREDQLQDGIISLGLQYGSAYSRAPEPPPEVPPEPAPVIEPIPFEPAPAPPPPPGDTDKDRVDDPADQCPGTPTTISATPEGCISDTDGDGIRDDVDHCPATPAGSAVEPIGCEPVKDGDGDGVTDDRDRCPGTAPGTEVDLNGCELVRDTDGDGVVDRDDRCPGTPTEFQVDDLGCVKVQTVVLTGVNFAMGGATLSPDAARTLDSVADSLRANPTLVVEVAGHTDALGSQAFNLQLSKRRATAVRDYLVGKGVPHERIVAEGYGEFQPAAENETEEGRGRNRRVEFRVLKK